MVLIVETCFLAHRCSGDGAEQLEKTFLSGNQDRDCCTWLVFWVFICALRRLMFSYRKNSNRVVGACVPSWLVLVQGNGLQWGHNWLLFWSKPCVSGNCRTANISTLSSACRLTNTRSCRRKEINNTFDKKLENIRKWITTWKALVVCSWLLCLHRWLWR